VENQTKERLTGIIVVLVLGVIFVPMLFNRASTYDLSSARIQQIPSQPPMPVVEKFEAKPAPVVETESNPILQQVKVWAVQIGSFSKKENAESLVNKLQEHGYAAYTNQRPNENDITSVLVGPEIRKEKANLLVQQLEKEMNIKGIVIQYQLT